MPEGESQNAATTRFEGAVPILRVESLRESLDYYTRILGFNLDWHEPGIIGSVSRGRCSLMLCEGDQGNRGNWVWIGVEDVEHLFTEYRNKGARVRHPPTNYPWACEMQIEDPDQNVLRIGSEPKKDEPCGEWLDMRGDLWAPSPDGGWSKVNAEPR